MAFDEVQFPTDISYGSTGGPGFSTAIIVSDGGAESRVSRWGQSRRRYDAAKGIQSVQQQSAVRDFYLARSGCARGFRWKDWGDYNTTATGGYDANGGQAFGDVHFANGDGAATQFQLTKLYTSGAITHVRKILKPVSGTVLIGIDGAQQFSGFTVDTTTGIVTFSSAPSNGAVLTWGGEFDVPARFDEAVDAVLAMRFDDFNSNSCQVPLVELLDQGEQPDAFYFGGAVETTMAANVLINPLQGRVQVFKASGGAVLLPNFSSLVAGGPYFLIVNDATSSASLAVKDSTGATTIVTLTAGQYAEFWLSVDAVGAKTWYALA